MDSFKVEIELPRDLLTALNVPASEIKQRTTEWVALALFQEGSVSSGKAAEMLGITKSEFISLLNQRRLPYLDVAPEELAHDMETAVSAAQ